MAHLNGRIYVDTTTDPPTGISIYDLQQVFHIGSGYLGYIISRAGAMDVINKWSIHKPERSAKLGILTFAERQTNMFGLDIPVCDRPTKLGDFVASYPTGYNYLVPAGTVDELFRPIDFDGYNDDANCFVYAEGCTFPNEYVYGQNGGGAYFSLGLNTGASLNADSIGIGNSDGLKYGSIPFSELYFGLLFVHGSTYKLVTSGNKLSDLTGTSLHIGESNNDGLDGLDKTVQYTVYPVLSLLYHTETPVSVGQDDEIVALPLSPFDFSQKSIVTQQSIAIVSCSANMIGGNLQVDFVLSMVGVPTSMTAAYDVYTASYIGDTEGSKIKGMSGIVQLTTSDRENVQEKRKMTNPQYVRVYAYNQNSQQVNTQRWAIVNSGPTPDPDEPLNIL